MLMMFMFITPMAFAQSPPDVDSVTRTGDVKVATETEKIDPDQFTFVNDTSAERGTRTWRGILSPGQGSMSAPAVWLNAGQTMVVTANWGPNWCTFRVGMIAQSGGVFYYGSGSGGALTVYCTAVVGGYYYPAVQNMGPDTASFAAVATW